MRYKSYYTYRFCKHSCSRTTLTCVRPSLSTTNLTRRRAQNSVRHYTASSTPIDRIPSTRSRHPHPQTPKPRTSAQTCSPTHQRSQHTQAKPLIDRTSEDVEEQEFENGVHEVEQGQDEEVIAEHPSTNTEDKNVAGELATLLRQHVPKPSERLLHVIGKHLPRAVPNVSISNISKDDDGNDVLDTKCVCCVRFTNEEYDISISNHVTFLDHSEVSFEAVLEDLARTYSDQLAAKLEADQFINDSTKPFPMHTLRDMLKIDRITVDFKPSDPLISGTVYPGLYLFQAYAGHTPMGKEQLWYDPGTAQRLARLSADADILQRAEMEGIDWDTIKLYPTTNRPPAKQRDKLNELPRVTDRIEPRTYHTSISEHTLSMMLYTLRQAREAGLPDEVLLEPLERRSTRRAAKYDQHHTKQIPDQLKVEETTKSVSSELKAIRSQRDKLPIRIPQTAKHILETIRKNDVVILVSETGSGKTTQLPQILLENAVRSGKGASCNILCTQPRRIAATSVAMRVAQECGTHVGGSVGYRVRFDSQPPKTLGSIDYVTAGVLLKMLQDESEDVLDQVSHIIIDEIHERSLPTDILTSFLRDLMRRKRSTGKPFPKIILMSATMRSVEFEQYFAEHHEPFTAKVASINIPGRAFPVTSFMLEDIIPTLANDYASKRAMIDLLKESKQYVSYEDEFAAQVESQMQNGDETGQGLGPKPAISKDPERDAIIPYGLITATVAHICNTYEKGDILVFLPGMKEIDMVTDFLESRLAGMHDPDKLRLFKLHAAFHGTNTRVFEPIPEGCRRIILATNIAQTSITLPGVVHVIDSGKQREMSYDQIRRRSTFDCVWIDQATSIQRRGRAGRVQNGYYWAMFTRTRFGAMSERTRSEMLISDLTTSSLILKSHSDTIDLHEFFAQTLEAPDPRVVSACVQELQELGMLTADERITPLGQFCSDIPLHPAKARGLLLGLLFGCFRQLLLIACHDMDTPLIHSPSERAELYHSNLAFAGVTDDDRYAFIRAFLEYDAACEKGSAGHMESLERKHIKRGVYQNMLNVARQIFEIMSRYDFFHDDDVLSLNETTNVFRFLRLNSGGNSDKVNLFKALGLSVVNTNLAVWDEEQSSWLAKDVKCILRPYSVNTKTSFKLTKRGTHRRTGEVVGYSEMLRNVITSTRPYLVETSTITPLIAVLFGGPITLLPDGTIEIDGWLRYKFHVKPATGESPVPETDEQSAAMVIFEFRKAIDRFITLAFQDLRKFPPRGMGIRRRAKRNRCFWPNKLRNSMRDGLQAILDADAAHWDMVLEKT